MSGGSRSARAAVVVVLLHVVVCHYDTTNHGWQLMAVDSEEGEDSEGCKSSPESPCRSLGYALNGANSLHQIAVSIQSGTHPVSERVALTNSHHIILQGSIGSIIDCAANGSIFIENSSNILLSGITFKNCQSPFDYDTAPENATASDKAARPGCVACGIFIRNCTNVTLEGVTVHQRAGPAAVLVGVTGRVKIERFQLIAVPSNSDEKHLCGVCWGSCLPSGILIKVTHTHAPDSAVANVSITDTSMSGLSDIGVVTLPQTSTVLSSSNQSTEVGGGITILFERHTSHAQVHLNNCSFTGGIARRGGAILIKFSDHAHRNTVLVNGSVFSRNMAIVEGGAVMITYPRNGTSKLTSTVTFTHCNFESNNADVGGAVSHGPPSPNLNIGHEFPVSLKFYKCNFKSNTAPVAPAISLRHSTVELVSTCVQYNKHMIQANGYVGQGAIRCLESKLAMDDVTVRLNDGTSVLLDSCSLQLTGRVLFSHNNGVHGGALAVYGGSLVNIAANATVMFVGNSVDNDGGKGGAIFVKNDRSSLHNSNDAHQQCFLSVPNAAAGTGPNLLFNGNNASTMGSAIFISTAKHCYLSKGELPLHKNGTIEYRNNPLPCVVTDPVKVAINLQEWNDTVPGSARPRSISILDEFGQSVFGTVKISILNEYGNNNIHAAVAGSNVFYGKDHMNVTLVGKERTPFVLAIDLVNNLDLNKRQLIKNLAMGSCRLGFYQKAREGTCRCLSEQGDRFGVMLCTAETAHVLKGLWGDPRSSTLLETRPCPSGYCNPACTKRTPLGCDYDGQRQCNAGRQWDSVLCGSCMDGMGVRFGDETCSADCTDMEVLKLMGVFVLIALLVLLVMFLNVDAYSGYLNAFLYSYQVMGTFLTGNANLDKVIGFVIGVSNMEGTGGVFGICVWKGLTNLDKMALNYCIPVFIIAFIGLVCFISSRLHNSYFTSNSCLSSFAILSVFAYCDFMRVTFKLLSMSTVRGKSVVYYAGGVEFFSKEHLFPAGIMAIFVMVFVVILFPAMILFSSNIVTLIPSFVRFDPIFEAFKSCFKNNMRHFSVFYFIARVLMLAVGTFMQHSTLQSVILTCFAMVIAVSFILCQPYRSPGMNYFDALLLCNVLLIGILTTGFGCIFLDHERIGLEKTVNILLYVPLAALVIRMLAAVARCVAKRSMHCEDKDPAGRAPFPKRAGDGSKHETFDAYEYHQVPA